jgi:hypothetical protein
MEFLLHVAYLDDAYCWVPCFATITGSWSCASIGVRMLRILSASAVAVLVLQATPLAAQGRSAVSAADLRAAVTDIRGENQATVLRFLQHDRVIQTAKDMGVSTADLSARVALLDDATLNQIAERTHAADLGLAGGAEYLVISTTLIIIVLLLLILVT